MKKIVLFSALIVMAVVSVAQAPKPVSKLVTIAGQHGGGQGSSSSGGHGSGYNGGGHGGYHHNSGQNMGPPAMRPADFRMAMDAVGRQTFDSDKLRIANQVLRGNFMTSVQVREMAMLFTFERYRVDFAKAAYLKVVDPQNYYVVNDAFTFSSSIAEVVKYTESVGFAGGGTWTSGHGGSNGGGHHNHAGPCSSACGGGGYGQNGYYGGGQAGGGAACGSGNGMTYSGGMNSVPVLPMCGMCSGYHEVNLVCEREFGNIAFAIDNRTFESDKILVAKQALRGKMVSSDQVRRLMDLFTFESTKLDFAKFAFRMTIDPQNYYIVNDGFTFSSSIRELDEFIRRG